MLFTYLNAFSYQLFDAIIYIYINDLEISEKKNNLGRKIFFPLSPHNSKR